MNVLFSELFATLAVQDYMTVDEITAVYSFNSKYLTMCQLLPWCLACIREQNTDPWALGVCLAMRRRQRIPDGINDPIP